MSECTLRTTGADPASGFARLGARWLELSADAAVEIARQGTVWLRSVTPARSGRSGSECCEIPESECPPRCVGEIHWRAVRGERLRCVVEVVNSGSQSREFRFAATPLNDGTAAGATPMVAPASATLPAGGSVAVTVELNVAEVFHPGGRYTGEVRLDGAYEQCVCLILEVESPVVNRLRVEQGDPPLRLRAHRWYDHFQCAESCVVSRPAPTIPPGNVAPAVVVDRLDPAKG